VKEKDSSFLLPPSAFPPPSLVLTSLGIGRVLADRDGVTFRAQGTCMYPTVRPGDVLRIASRPVAQVNVGDIAVCRGNGYLFGHRVIGKSERDGHAYIVTRPDRTRQGSDAPTFDDNLLGVVVAIERNGKGVPLTPQAYPWLARRFFAARSWWIETQPRAWWWLVTALARLQDRAVCRWLARRWFALARPHVSFVIRLPLRATDGVYQQIPVAEFTPANGEWNGRKIERWMLALHLGADKQPAALVTFQASPDGWVAHKTFRCAFAIAGWGSKTRCWSRRDR
jgi:hypothetical protein